MAFISECFSSYIIIFNIISNVRFVTNWYIKISRHERGGEHYMHYPSIIISFLSVNKFIVPITVFAQLLQKYLQYYQTGLVVWTIIYHYLFEQRIARLFSDRPFLMICPNLMKLSPSALIVTSTFSPIITSCHYKSLLKMIANNTVSKYRPFQGTYCITYLI